MLGKEPDLACAPMSLALVSDRLGCVLRLMVVILNQAASVETSLSVGILGRLAD